MSEELKPPVHPHPHIHTMKSRMSQNQITHIGHRPYTHNPTTHPEQKHTHTHIRTPHTPCTHDTPHTHHTETHPTHHTHITHPTHTIHTRHTSYKQDTHPPHTLYTQYTHHTHALTFLSLSQGQSHSGEKLAQNLHTFCTRSQTSRNSSIRKIKNKNAKNFALQANSMLRPEGHVPYPSQRGENTQLFTHKALQKMSYHIKHPPPPCLKKGTLVSLRAM